MQGNPKYCRRFSSILVALLFFLNETGSWSKARGAEEEEAHMQPTGTSAQGLYPAMFIFGDSLVDNGNNNFLTTLARADFPPNGVDFGSGWPTGRFCNGRTVSDYIGILLGIDPVPAYLAMLGESDLEGLEHGVNFASGAAGILDESGYNYLGRIPMSQQLGYFASLKEDLVNQKGEVDARSFLHKSVFMSILGSNDYINNYLLSDSSARRVYNAQAYQDLVVSTYVQQLQALYENGARKIVVFGVGPLGCIPNIMFVFKSPDGSCIENPVNKLVRSFNTALESSLEDLMKKHKGLYILYADTYNKMVSFTQNSTLYGFANGNTSCCGQGKYGAETPCLPTSFVCSDRSSYVFWDSHHPSDRANLLMSSDYVSGGNEFIRPMNLLQLAIL
ncbi:unnamed protein product [Calypogeia fissa]